MKTIPFDKIHLTGTRQVIFGKNIKAIENFILIADYTELMTSYDVAIYRNWRQETVGNIMVSIYLGAKVFISNRNPILKWTSGINLLFSNCIALNKRSLAHLLIRMHGEKNRSILLQEFDGKTLYNNMEYIFEEKMKKNESIDNQI